MMQEANEADQFESDKDKDKQDSTILEKSDMTDP